MAMSVSYGHRREGSLLTPPRLGDVPPRGVACEAASSCGERRSVPFIDINNKINGQTPVLPKFSKKTTFSDPKLKVRIFLGGKPLFSAFLYQKRRNACARPRASLRAHFPKKPHLKWHIRPRLGLRVYAQKAGRPNRKNVGDWFLNPPSNFCFFLFNRRSEGILKMGDSTLLNRFFENFCLTAGQTAKINGFSRSFRLQKSMKPQVRRHGGLKRPFLPESPVFSCFFESFEYCKLVIENVNVQWRWCS